MHSGPHMHATGRKLEEVEVVPEHVMAQEAVYALQVLLRLALWKLESMYVMYTAESAVASVPLSHSH